MGIFGNFFMSESEKAKLDKMNRRRVTRAVERVLENLEDKSALLNRECTALWEKARKQLLSGQKEEAAGTLRFYKSKQVMSRKIDHQLMMTRYRYDAIAGASDMQEVMGALNALAVNVDVDVDDLAEKMEQIDEAACENKEVCDVIDAAFQKDMAKLDRDLAVSQEGDEDELMKALENELAGGAAAGENIASGQERLRSMLNGKK